MGNAGCVRGKRGSPSNQLSMSRKKSSRKWPALRKGPDHASAPGI